MRLARDSAGAGWLPQSMELGLVSGALAAWVAQAVHSFFDYRLHIAPVALLLGLSAGWLASARTDPTLRGPSPAPRWLRCLALLPLLPGGVLAWWVWRDAPVEYCALRADNALLQGDASAWAENVAAGEALDPTNPRLLELSARLAVLRRGADLEEFSSGPLAESAAESWSELVAQRPGFALGSLEYALAQTHRGLFAEALPFHLRAIGREPDYATGYEYLGYYFLRRERYEEALRLFRLARLLPGAQVSPQEIAAIEEYARQLSP